MLRGTGAGLLVQNPDLQRNRIVTHIDLKDVSRMQVDIWLQNRIRPAGGGIAVSIQPGEASLLPGLVIEEVEFYGNAFGDF